MAQFRGAVRGGRGEATRLGHKSTGLTTVADGWQSGVRVTADYQEGRGRDMFAVDFTTGSGGYTTMGRVDYWMDEQGYHFEPDEVLLDNITTNAWERALADPAIGPRLAKRLRQLVFKHMEKSQ